MVPILLIRSVERLRDEVRKGKSLRTAVERGWQRARRTILASDSVSFIAAAVPYKFAVTDVQNFAFALGLTTLVDVIVVFLFTKPMVTLLARTKFYGGGHRLPDGPAGLSLGVCVGIDESMPAVKRDRWARFITSALMAIRLFHETDESTSPERQQAQTEATAALVIGTLPMRPCCFSAWAG